MGNYKKLSNMFVNNKFRELDSDEKVQSFTI